MKIYNVTLPITGVIYTQVEAESEEDAIDKALLSEVSIRDIETWDVHRKIVEGNVFHGEVNEASAEPEDGEEEEEE